MLVIESDPFEDTTDIGIIESKLLRLAPVFCGKIALLRAALPTPLQTAPVPHTNADADADLWGSNPFHHFTYWKGRPGTILFGWHPGQKLADVLIPDVRTVVLSAETPHFVHPGGAVLAGYPDKLRIHHCRPRGAGDARSCGRHLWRRPRGGLADLGRPEHR